MSDVVKIKRVDLSIKVDTDVPIPIGKVISKYPFGTMNVGDSFLIPPHIVPQYVSSQAREFGFRHKRKFTVRKTPDGHRCWRTE